MGMFEQWQNFTEHFEEGDVFELEAIKTATITTTEYGERRAAVLKIGGAWYSVFGEGIVAQADRTEDGDLPARVSVRRTTNKRGQPLKLLVPEGQTAPAGDDIPF